MAELVCLELAYGDGVLHLWKRDEACLHSYSLGPDLWKATPSSGSISSARGLASPVQLSQCSPTGANVSGFESSPFWR